MKLNKILYSKVMFFIISLFVMAGELGLGACKRFAYEVEIPNELK